MPNKLPYIISQTLGGNVPTNTTKTAQFTPGPWRISECQLGKKLLIQHGDENTLSPIVGSVYHDDGKLPQHANANLIAAAPAMYEA